MKKRFLITSLLSAGFLPQESADAIPQSSGLNPQRVLKPALLKPFHLDHKYSLAAHGSHRSHGSHASHRSSSGGGFAVPRSRNFNSTPPSSTLPSPPAAAPQYEPPPPPILL